VFSVFSWFLGFPFSTFCAPSEIDQWASIAGRGAGRVLIGVVSQKEERKKNQKN
jgi:hypothetical protein